RAARDYADSVVQTQAAIAAAQGKSGDFAGRLFEIQNRQNINAAVSNNDPAQVARLRALKAIADAQAKIGDIERASAVQLSLLNTEQSRVDLQRQTMQIGEIEALN